MKKVRKGKVKVALAFPDTYDIGMSNLGFSIIYNVINLREDALAERVFAPWIDMEKYLREKDLPLLTLETGTPVSEFDILGFSLSYELNYSNVVNILDLSRISILSSNRDGLPLVIAGGGCTTHPAPLLDIIDCFAVGDGEELINEVIDIFKEWKESSNRKEELLEALSSIDGLYVPLFHKDVKRRIVRDLSKVPYPTRPLVPNTEVIHDRAVVEIMRGCTRGCRFCEAGFIYRPVRERDLKDVISLSEEILSSTGYSEIGFLSLSASDYSQIEGLARYIRERLIPLHISVSVPSLRVDTSSQELFHAIGEIKRGITFAPEAGSQRLRDIINKNITEDNILNSIKVTSKEGWRSVKLYFMIGLPTEKEEDILEIVRLINEIRRINRNVEINASISTFVPKPHTPFQWVRQISPDEVMEKITLITKNLSRKGINISWTDPFVSVLEGILTRGGTELTEVILDVWRNGARFDAWTDQFRWGLWEEAFDRHNIDWTNYLREKRYEDPLPWNFIDIGVRKEFLWEEYQLALSGVRREDCRIRGCYNCGVCPY
ncbi:MAG: radical SAM protein [bacterium]